MKFFLLFLTVMKFIQRDWFRFLQMYCTGGIRCDVYSTFLRKKGYNNLFSLEGGVHNYFDKEGGDLWNGSLFVFDERLAVPPSKDSMKGRSIKDAHFLFPTSLSLWSLLERV